MVRSRGLYQRVDGKEMVPIFGDQAQTHISKSFNLPCSGKYSNKCSSIPAVLFNPFLEIYPPECDIKKIINANRNV